MKDLSEAEDITVDAYLQKVLKFSHNTQDLFGGPNGSSVAIDKILFKVCVLFKAKSVMFFFKFWFFDFLG